MPSCPICTTPMTQEERSGVPIDVCAAHGIWLDKSELLRITEAERHEQGRFVWADVFRKEITPPHTDDRPISCPHCAQPMGHALYERVEMDWCKQHGVWLDNGELEAILNNLRLDDSYLRGMRLRLWEGQF